jgi:hypothetical protein
MRILFKIQNLRYWLDALSWTLSGTVQTTGSAKVQPHAHAPLMQAPLVVGVNIDQASLLFSHYQTSKPAELKHTTIQSASNLATDTMQSGISGNPHSRLHLIPPSNLPQLPRSSSPPSGPSSPRPPSVVSLPPSKMKPSSPAPLSPPPHPPSSPTSRP